MRAILITNMTMLGAVAKVMDWFELESRSRWRFDPAKSVEVIRLGVQTWFWPR